jgi:hypothetical protein
LIINSFNHVANNKIFRSHFHQLHRNDWSFGSEKSISAFCCRLGGMDHLFTEPSGKKKKGTRQRATHKENLGQALEPKKEFYGSKRSHQIKTERTKADKRKALFGKKGLFHVCILDQ